MMSPTDVEENLRRIFKRCVQCPPGAPVCPPCAADETCSLQAQSCNACATTTCVKVGSLPGQALVPTGPPVGAIAGGVIGGVAAIVILTWLVWRFCIRNRRQAYDEQLWSDNRVEKRNTTSRMSGRAQSTRSVASMTSTVITRASNVIQIAYIPGITNRSPPDSPAVLTPPVPPIPSALSSPRFAEGAHFFMPGDLRDSTYSDMSEEQRHSMAPSITPSLARASVATTIFQGTSEVSPQPAQRAFRTGAPAVISVKSGHSTPGSASVTSINTPPVPNIPRQHIANSSIVGQNLKPRPIEVRKTSSKNSMPTLINLTKAASKETLGSTAPQEVYSDEKEVLFAKKDAKLVDTSGAATPDLMPRPSFLNDDPNRTSQVSAILPTEGPLAHGHANTSSSTDSSALNALIEDALNRAAAVHNPPSPRPGLHKQLSTDSGPFSDSNAMKENRDDMSR